DQRVLAVVGDRCAFRVRDTVELRGDRRRGEIVDIDRRRDRGLELVAGDEIFAVDGDLHLRTALVDDEVIRAGGRRASAVTGRGRGDGVELRFADDRSRR